MICSEAPAKVLLFGEHFVVLGKPALGLAVSVYARACVEEGRGKAFSKQVGEIREEDPIYRAIQVIRDNASRACGRALDHLDVYIDSSVPLGAGMGSSAAVNVSIAHSALSLCLGKPNRELVNRIAYEAEKVIHIRPSGVDNTISTYGGFLYYEAGRFQRLDIELPKDLRLLVVNTNIKRNTGEIVSQVLERYRRHEAVLGHVYNAAGELVKKAVDYIREGKAELLGELMLINHGLLWGIGASSQKCDEIIYKVLEHGGLGGKLSGAGRGGIVIGLFRGEVPRGLLEELRALGYQAMDIKPDYAGVRKIEANSPGFPTGAGEEIRE